ncbi:MAG: MarR family transcriptional regulator [Candidatus Kapabacteria bacterium]|nr:MarR family transcriptional regulator [Ignavibacteriota bacterium]MCW5884545.1 MarR family transcriptional regulator [Candidatus Kapabacteria bacterium]
MNQIANNCSDNIGIELMKLHCSVGFFIGYVSNSMRNSLTRIFQENGYDITHSQWLILMMLWMKDGRRQNELTELVYKEKTTITRLIDNMEKKNLLIRVPDLQDKRNKYVYLTNSGKELRDKLTPMVLNLNKKASEGLSDEELVNLKSVLTKIHNNLIDES